MCTVLTVSSGFFSRTLEERIKIDGEGNPDGFSLLLVDEDGAHTIIRTMSVDTVISVLRGAAWSRMFLHTRYATQGSIGLANTHGWEADGVFYFHNGCLSAPEALALPVDSMAIGLWLDEGGVAFALSRLATETFANVFLVDTETGKYTVSRSLSGQLYTDGEGNFSTVPFWTITEPVSVGAQTFQFAELAEKTPVSSVWDIDTVDDIRFARERWGIEIHEADVLDTVDEIRTYREAFGDYEIGEDGIDDYISPSLRRTGTK